LLSVGYLSRAEAIIREIFTQKTTPATEETPDAYLISFCETSDLLSQWRAYGKSAGFEIRFNSLTSDNNPYGDLQSPAVSMLRLVRIEYDLAAQKENLRTIIQNSVECLSTLLDTGSLSSEVEPLAAFFATMEMLVWFYSSKHPKFAEEREWRVIAFPFLHGAPEQYSKPELVKFRVGRHSLVPYIELRSSKPKLPISEIICGPGGHRSLTAKAVRLLLKSTGFENIIVRNSEVPLAPG